MNKVIGAYNFAKNNWKWLAALFALSGTYGVVKVVPGGDVVTKPIQHQIEIVTGKLQYVSDTAQ